MEIRSSLYPNAAEGAWIVSDSENIYVYGGRGETRSSNILWKYNTGTHAYTEESREDFTSPIVSSYHKCFIQGDQILVALGLTDDLSNPTELD